MCVSLNFVFIAEKGVQEAVPGLFLFGVFALFFLFFFLPVPEYGFDPGTAVAVSVVVLLLRLVFRYVRRLVSDIHSTLLSGRIRRVVVAFPVVSLFEDIDVFHACSVFQREGKQSYGRGRAVVAQSRETA